MGTRLGSAEAGVPKPLMSIGGTPLVGYALAQAEASGCSEAVVVIGYEGARVREAVEAIDTSMTIRFVENPDPSRAQRPLAAGRRSGRRAAVFSADGRPPVRDPGAGEAGGDGDAGRAKSARLLVDRAPIGLDLSDATKVRIEAERITAIGKRLEPWDAIDTGVFLLTRSVFDAIRERPGFRAAHRVVGDAEAGARTARSAPSTSAASPGSMSTRRRIVTTPSSASPTWGRTAPVEVVAAPGT